MDDRTIFIVGVIVFIFMAAYCTTLFLILRKVPEEKRVFPAWFVWFFLVPIVGFVFQWMMIPFGIPLSLRNAVKKDQNAIHATKILTYLGLIQVLLPTVGLFIHKSTLSMILAGAGIAVWAIYWVTIVWFKSKYLND
ncbi:MAG: hypothetical protein Q8L78_02525 [Coxiellaceae bacterium]|nr:hypothetical protein [Coxiellaceae bacterium]